MMGLWIGFGILFILCIILIGIYANDNTVESIEISTISLTNNIKVNKLVILGTIVKNVDSTFNVFEQWVLQLKIDVPNLRLFIYENNSNDKTPEILAEFQSRNSEWVSCKCEILDTSPAFFPTREINENRVCRIAVISYARNQLVNMIKATQSFDLNTPIVFIDADFKKSPSIGPLLQILNDFDNMDVDAVMANGKTGPSQKYYDIFALRAHQFSLLGPELIGEKFWTDFVYDPNAYFYPEQIGELVPVFSAFAGLGIYKAYCLEHLQYSALPTPALFEMYKHMMDSFPDHKSVQFYKQNHIGSEDEIKFQSNSGHDEPVCCEHIPAHAELWKHGLGKLFIHSKLEYYW